jgi:hypothetical protein
MRAAFKSSRRDKIMRMGSGALIIASAAVWGSIAPVRMPALRRLRRHLRHEGGGIQCDCPFMAPMATLIATKNAKNARVFIINKEIAHFRNLFCCNRIDWVIALFLNALLVDF